MHDLLEPGLLGAIALFILDKVWTMVSRKTDKYQEALAKNTNALIRLETTMKFFEDRLVKLEDK